MALNLTVRKIFIILLCLCGAFHVWNSEAHAAQLRLSWVDNASNEDGFKVQRKTGTTGTYAQIASVGANVSSYTDSTVVAGTTYCYEVLAFNSAGDSPTSPEVCGSAVVSTFLLTVSKAGTGSGTVSSSPAGINNCTPSPPCSASFSGNVQITAAAAAGSTFTGWTGNADCSDGSLTMNAAKSCTANFTVQMAQTFLLSVTKAGTGSGTVSSSPAGINNCNPSPSCSASFNGNVLLTATAAAGSTFLNWTGNADCSDGSVTMNAAKSCTANFQVKSNTNQLATRIGTFRPSTGEWFLDLNGNGKWDDSADAHLTSFPHDNGDLPVVGNWNADGTSSVGTFNPATGTWRVDTNGNDQWDGCEVDTCVNSYGKTGDWPVIRKVNGIESIIGTFTPAFVTTTNRRRSVKRGLWNFDLNGNSTMDACSVDECDTFGSGFERPIIGDWNGNGSENIGLFLNGYWYLDLNGNEKWDGSRGDRLFAFGRRGDLPVVGDWDGTGVTNIGVFRSSTGEWFLDKTGNGKFDGCQIDTCISASATYQEGDLPVVGKW